MSSLSLINKLLNHFDNNEQSRIIERIKSLQQIVINETIQIDKIQETVSKIVCDIIKDDYNNETKTSIDCMNDNVYKLFLKYYDIIITMKDPMINKTETTENESISFEYKTFKIKHENNIKWQIFCEIIEHLMCYLYQNDLIQSELIWKNIIKQLLLKNPEIHTKRKIISLSRIIISFGRKLIEENDDKSLIIECKKLLKQFIVDFIPINYKQHKQYNDLHTLQDINNVFQLFEHIDKKKSKKRKRKKKRKNANNNVLKLLSQEMELYYDKTRVIGKEKQCKNELIRRIGYLWKKVLFSTLPSLKSQANHKTFNGAAHVHLFGSSATKLDSKGSDIDLYLTTPQHLAVSVSGEWELFQQLSIELETNNCKQKLNVTNIFNCTVPIIKIKDEINNIFVDISFGKSYENCKIVQLINAFCDYNNDVRIRQLIIAIKYWAKQRELNDAQKNLLNSFGFVLLTIKYLQSQNDYNSGKILPMLKKIKNIDTYLCNQVELLIDHKNNKQNQGKHKKLFLADLLIGFFDYYSVFDYVNQSISLFKQKVMKKNRKYRDLAGYTLKGNKLTFVIEDPIQTLYNCSKNIRESTANLMKIEFLRAKILLKYCNGTFADLCKPVT